MSKIIAIVGLGSCGIAAGAGKIFDKLNLFAESKKYDVLVKKTSCIGMCYREPLVEIIDKFGKYLYGGVDENILEEILEQHTKKQSPLNKYVVHSELLKTKDDVFWEGQIKIALRHCGYIDPESIEEYEKYDGYKALRKIADKNISRDDVIKEILDSGLRGRGGGGFLTGLKWKFAKAEVSDVKYIICNADEGDPGAFMDKNLLEGDPHSIIEGMIIGAYAIGASVGIVYCRAEYPLAIVRINIALEQARKNGYLGKNIMNIKGFDLDIYVKEGAGAFVCGEETALMSSIEGKRGMPRKRPPYPAVSGLWKEPTNINNVETYSNVSWIINKGAVAYSKYGTEKSKGTKAFSLTGKINHGGLIEVPMGISIHDIVFKLGGGIQDGKKFKAVQLGGPSGGCIPAHLDNTIVDYDSVNATGAIMGSGGIVVMDETTCMVDIARFFLDFTQKESCGKCTFCRVGTKRMLEILTRITEGEGKDGDIETLETLSYQIKDGSLCGLGQTAPNPVLTTIKYFREEYEAHINDKRCPAGSCTKLLSYEIIPDLCTGCRICAINCPSSAIDGAKKEIHFIRQSDCISCGICVIKCNFDAIKVY